MESSLLTLMASLAEHGLWACRLSCPVVCEILVPGLEIELMLPALAGVFLTTGPPGKSQDSVFRMLCLNVKYTLVFRYIDSKMFCLRFSEFLSDFNMPIGSRAN